MTAAQDLQQLFQVTQASEPRVIFGSRPKDDADEPFFVRRLLQSTGLANTLLAKGLAHLEKLSTEVNVNELQEYTGDYKADADEPRFLTIEDEPSIKAVYDSITENTASMTPFDPEERGYKGRLSYYCLQCKDPQGNIIRFYQKMPLSQRLKPTNKVLAQLVGARFEEVDQHAVTFDPGFVCVSYKGRLFIFGTAGFETLFHYYQELEEHAAEALDEVHTDHIPIENFDDLRARLLGNKANIKRLRNIAKRGHLATYTVASMTQTIQDFGLNIQVTQDATGKPRLHWEDGQEQEVLKLLDDYYLRSPTSNKNYGSNSKQIID